MWIVFISCILAIMVVTTVSHAPLFRINGVTREEIKTNGLIHFTSQENYQKIKDIGLIGKKADMGFPETLLGELVWTYQYDSLEDIDRKHNIVVSKARGKFDPDRYGVCIRITGFSESNLKRLYTRRGLIRDNAIVFRGKVLKYNNIEVVKVW